MTTHDNREPQEGWVCQPRPQRRILQDGCEGCGYSAVYCDCNRDLSGQPCCEDCDHGHSPVP